MKEGDICPHCHKDKLEYCPAVYPWSSEHLICGHCDSTFNIGDE